MPHIARQPVLPARISSRMLGSSSCTRQAAMPSTTSEDVRQPLLSDQRQPTLRVVDPEPIEDGRDGDGNETAVNGAYEGTFKRNLGAVEAFAIIISIVIGSGIFTSPGAIDTNVLSVGAALLVWVVGGVLAWTGAMTMAELGTAIPGEGLSPLPMNAPSDGCVLRRVTAYPSFRRRSAIPAVHFR